MRVAEAMTAPVPTASCRAILEQALRLMQHNSAATVGVANAVGQGHTPQINYRAACHDDGTSGKPVAARPTRRAVSMTNTASSERLDAIHTRNARRAVALMRAHIEASQLALHRELQLTRKQRAPTRDRELRNPPNLMIV